MACLTLSPEPARRDRDRAALTATRDAVEDTATYWLTTIRADGRPHIMPVRAVRLDGALYFSAGRTSAKGRNLSRNAFCTVMTGPSALDLRAKGTAARVSDAAALHRVAAAFAAKYEWQVTVRDGGLCADGAPAVGGPVYDVYRVTPAASAGRPARPAPSRTCHGRARPPEVRCWTAGVARPVPNIS